MAGNLPQPEGFIGLVSDEYEATDGAESGLNLMQLSTGCPGLTSAIGTSLAEAAAVCLDERGHSIHAFLTVSGSFQEKLQTTRSEVTDQMRRAWADRDEATESGACGVAILLILNLAELTVVERSYKGPGFDYWLGNESADLPFENKARLEVSGIRSGDEQAIQKRVREKLKQTEKSDGVFPKYIVVVEFSRPEARVVLR